MLQHDPSPFSSPVTFDRGRGSFGLYTHQSPFAPSRSHQAKTALLRTGSSSLYTEKPEPRSNMSSAGLGLQTSPTINTTSKSDTTVQTVLEKLRIQVLAVHSRKAPLAHRRNYSQVGAIAMSFAVFLILLHYSFFMRNFVFHHNFRTFNGTSYDKNEPPSATIQHLRQLFTYRGIVQTFLLVMVLWSFIQTAITNPGAPPPIVKTPYDEKLIRRDTNTEIVCESVKKEIKGLTQAENESRQRYCKHCENYKPDRVHHCRWCNACVLRMDHHCPWVNNCIGYFNMKFFLQLLFYGFFFALYHCYLLFHMIKHHWWWVRHAARAGAGNAAGGHGKNHLNAERDSSWWSWFFGNSSSHIGGAGGGADASGKAIASSGAVGTFSIGFYLSALISFALFFAITGLTIFHFAGLFLDRTSIEMMDPRKRVSVRQKVVSVLGRNVRHWFLPYQPELPGDGITWHFPLV
ncbi:unnamed protein product [Amoebophrya sp. A120]|nr:unnamed protein product [Amoebophrya sp. A120]|eukprot:GSA120T00010495001.1